MLKITRINDEPLILNADLIKFVEEKPDTIITLQSGDRILVKESAQEVMNRVIEYARSIRTLPEQIEMHGNTNGEV